MKAAVIGLGVGQEHLRAYKEMGVEITCVIDWDKELRENVAAQYNCRSASQLTPASQEKEHLADADIVSICSYDQFHFEQIKMLWEQGKHVIVEKPPCLRADEVDRLRAMDANPKQSFMCNLPLTYHPAFQPFATTDFGHIYLVEGGYYWGRPHKLMEWRKDCPGYSIVLGAGLHIVDLMLWVKEHFIGNGGGIGGNFNVPEFDGNDTVVAMWKFLDGALGKLELLCGTTGEHAHALQVYGTKDHMSVRNPDEVDKTLPIRAFINKLQKGEKWNNDRLFHALDVCFSIEATANE